MTSSAGHEGRCGVFYGRRCTCRTERRNRVEKAIADAKDKTKRWPGSDEKGAEADDAH